MDGCIAKHNKNDFRYVYVHGYIYNAAAYSIATARHSNVTCTLITVLASHITSRKPHIFTYIPKVNILIH